MSEINYQAAQEYLTSLVPPRELELHKMEVYAEENDVPIIGPVCGYYCYQLARMITPGPSLSLAQDLGIRQLGSRKRSENGGGVVHHTVLDDDMSARAREHLSVLGLEDLVQSHHP